MGSLPLRSAAKPRPAKHDPRARAHVAGGALVAADGPLPLPWTASLAIALGLLHGIWNGTEVARTGTGGFANALGVACALFVVVAILSALVASLRAPWSRIVVRVAGSWIAAAALFMLGWTLRGA
jgi:hydrogenase/urease accessory protein HupE